MMLIFVIAIISFFQSVSSRTTGDIQNSLTSTRKSISSSLPFEHRSIPEDTNIDTKQDQDLSSTDVQTMILGVAALVIFLPMLVMGVFYVWMLYQFSCKGKKSFPDSVFANLVLDYLTSLDYLSGAVGMADDVWSDRCR